MRLLVVAATLFAFAALCPTPTAMAQAGDRARAQAAYARAVELERLGRHEEAGAAYREAYSQAGGRELMYVIIGQSPDGSSRPLLEALSRLIDGAPAPSDIGLPSVALPPAAAVGPAVAPSVGPVVAPAGQVSVATSASAGDPPVASAASPTAEPVRTRAVSGPPPGHIDESIPRQNEVGVLSWALAGLGGAALLGGGITGILTLETESELADRCPGTVCPPEEADRLERAQVMGTATTGLLIGGGAALAAGVLIGLLWPNDEEPGQTQVAAACTNEGCLGLVQGSF